MLARMGANASKISSGTSKGRFRSYRFRDAKTAPVIVDYRFTLRHLRPYLRLNGFLC